MKKQFGLIILGLVVLLAADSSAQKKPKQSTYIGYVYPAGGQQGTTVPVRLGGQRITKIHGVTVSGEGVQVQLIECRNRLNPQDGRLLKEQKKLLKGSDSFVAKRISERITSVMGGYERKPANASLSIIVFVEVTIDEDAAPGLREIRLLTGQGLSNPLPFYIGQLAEYSREPMRTSKEQTLGKEHLALRKRPDEDIEETITLPCTLNGQIASGEVNRYRFNAEKGQKLVITTLARQLIPYIADAVPGWFQPILTLETAEGKEVAYNDDYFFKPDPTILYAVENDGQYVLTINDSIYRGREDFVYRITIGENPFVTSIYPLGGQVGKPAVTKIEGWSLQRTKLSIPNELDTEGVHRIAANRRDILSNHVPFALDTLPERMENENENNTLETARRITLPIIINGRSDRPGDQDIFKILAKKGDQLVAEVHARRLDSPLDSLLKITDAEGRIMAFNDDHSDPASGLNTHHADSYLQIEFPTAGHYYIHLSDTSRNGGKAYAYRLRLSRPRPDFELRAVPSRINLRGKSGGSVEIFAIRKDGYKGPIKLNIKNAPNGISAKTITLPAGKEKVKFIVKNTLQKLDKPINLHIEGSATVGKRTIKRRAVPAEDWMQAFLWRHLVPTEELLLQVYNPSMLPTPDRKLPKARGLVVEMAGKNFNRLDKAQKQVIGQVKRLDKLYLDWLITDAFYLKKIDEYNGFLAETDIKE